jgi:hypothetical protein
MHVGMVEETKMMSKELMLKEQRKDLFCKEQTQPSYSKRSIFVDMEFCVWGRGKHPKLVVPVSDTRRNR